MEFKEGEIIIECPNSYNRRMSVGGSSEIKVTHVPTGTVAIVNIGRSQWKNRQIALDMIEWALVEGRWTNV